MNGLKVVIVVSSDPSDLYFANRLSRRLGAAAVVVERGAAPAPFARRLGRWAARAARVWEVPRLLRERRVVSEHVRRADEIDRAGFGEDGYTLRVPNGCLVLEAGGRDGVNAPETAQRLRELEPDLLLLCGCSIVKAGLLSVPRLGTLNLHGGLAQRYRGVWTTLWAVVNREPEYVGATVHFVSPGIDDGDIVFQARPEIEPGDNPESLYVKVVKLGVEMMATAVAGLSEGTLSRFPLEEKGKLYLSRMVTPEVLEDAWRATEEGVIPLYLAEKAARDAGVVALMRGPFPAPEAPHVRT